MQEIVSRLAFLLARSMWLNGDLLRKSLLRIPLLLAEITNSFSDFFVIHF